jgi:hypothetical protein
MIGQSSYEIEGRIDKGTCVTVSTHMFAKCYYVQAIASSIPARVRLREIEAKMNGLLKPDMYRRA